jgi:hypothetical protein
MAANNTLWPQEHSDMLSSLLKTTSLSFSEIQVQMNAALKTYYTRNAILGRAYRMNHCITRPPVAPEIRAQKKRERLTRLNEKKKAQRHAAKPWLATRADRAKEQKRVRAMFDATGTSRTSAGYRKHFPRLPEMTKDELRGMLADAMRNTSVMGFAE